MKKRNLIYSLLISIAVLSTSCSTQETSNKDKSHADKIETLQDKADNSQSRIPKGGDTQVMNALNNIQNSNSMNEADVSVIINYMEDNAETFFNNLEQHMPMINNALQGKEPSEKDSNAFNDFVESNQAYFECIGFAIGADGQLSDESQQRLDKLAKQNAKGFENVGIILGVAMQMNPEVANSMNDVLN